MVQVAATGVVDFGRADPRDPKWWRYLKLMIEQKELENLKEYHRLYNDRVVAVLSRTDLTQTATTSLLEESDSQIGSIAKILFPWADLDRDSIRQDQAKRLRASWESWFGKLDDPETQQRIQNTTEWLRNTDGRKAPGKGKK